MNALTTIPSTYANSKYVKQLAQRADRNEMKASELRKELKESNSGRGKLIKSGAVATPSGAVVGVVDGALEENFGSGVSAGVMAAVASATAIITGNSVAGDVAIGMSAGAAALAGRRGGLKLRAKFKKATG